MKFGIRTFQQDAAENGDDWREIMEDNMESAGTLLDNAKTLSDKHKIPLVMAVELLSQRSPNPQSLTGSTTEPEPGDSEPDNQTQKDDRAKALAQLADDSEARTYKLQQRLK